MSLFDNWIWIDSVLKLLLYGPRFKMIYSESWKYLGIWCSYFLMSWKYLESHVFYFPLSWKYWKLKSPTLSIVLEMLGVEVCNILHNLEIRAAGGWRRAGSSRGCVVLPWIIFGTCSWKNEHGSLGIQVKRSTCFENGFPSETTMLTRSASKFCVGPRSPDSNIWDYISHHDHKKTLQI